MDVREKTASEKRLIDYYYLAEKIECPGVRLVYWDDIESAPTVDAVEVVRCAQCKHFKRNLENDTYCSSVNGLTDPQEDDFCSYGERKEGTDNDQA